MDTKVLRAPMDYCKIVGELEVFIAAVLLDSLLEPLVLTAAREVLHINDTYE